MKRFIVFLFGLAMLHSISLAQISIDNLDGNEIIYLDKDTAGGGTIIVRDSMGRNRLISNGALGGFEVFDESTIRRILLNGTNGRIELSNPNDFKTITLNSHWNAGGRILLRDNNEEARIEMNARNSGTLDPVIIMRNSLLNTTIQMEGEGENDAGKLTLFNDQGDPRVDLVAKPNVGDDGGSLFLSNEANTITARIDASDNLGGGRLTLRDSLGNDRFDLRAVEFAGQGPSLKLFNENDEVAIELDGDFNGDGRVITDEIEIKGGSDLAEHFYIHDKEAYPGMIVSIDPDNPGNLAVSDLKYDKLVAGVISGAKGIQSGLIMGQEGSAADGDIPVAIAGRVFLRTTSINGQIRPGDFLTSSGDRGIAMKVKNLRKAQGAIIGKVLIGPDEDGFALVLLNLQ